MHAARPARLTQKSGHVLAKKQGKVDRAIGFFTPQIHRLKSRLVGEVQQFQKKLLTNLK